VSIFESALFWRLPLSVEVGAGISKAGLCPEPRRGESGNVAIAFGEKMRSGNNRYIAGKVIVSTTQNWWSHSPKNVRLL
jgi:hypothetical protein